MDKYEYRVSLNEINSLVEEKRFPEAAQIADTIDWRKVKSKDTLCRISDIYKICKDYERARDILDLANQRNPHIPEIIYSLCELTIYLYGQTGSQADLAKAIGLKQEYQSAYPDDPKRLILEYKFYKVSPVTTTEKIATLEQLRDEEHSPRWGYELAALYHEAGMDELALDECKSIRREFGGRFAERAAMLIDEIHSMPESRDEAPEADAAENAAQRPERREEQPAAEDAADEVAAAEPVAEEPAAEAPAAPETAESVETPAEEAVPAREEPVSNEAPVDRAEVETAPAAEEPEISGVRRIPYAAEPAPAPVEETPEEPVRTGHRAWRIEDAEPEAPETPAEAEPVVASTAEDQLSVGQVYDEWERIRKDIRKRNDEKRAQRIMEDTGPLLQDFDETARHGLIEAIEKDAARQRRQIRSGAAGILGSDAGYGGGSYGQGGRGRYDDPYGDRGGRGYDDRRGYRAPADEDYDRPAQDRYDDRYDDRYAEPTDDRYDDRYAEPAEDRYDDRYPDDRYDDRYDERPSYEPLPEPEREEIHAETVHEEPEYEEAPGRYEDRGSVRGARNDRQSGFAAGAAAGAAAGYAAGAARGSRFNAAVAADAANVVADVAGDAVENLSEDDDIATRRWNSDEIREAMERQRVRIAEAQAEAEREAAERAAAEEAARIAAEEEARRQAEEEAARKAAEEKAAERARIEAEIRAEYEARERARIEAEEAARREAEEQARIAAEEEAARKAAEEKAREEAEAKARMYAEIEAQIRAEFEAREQARLAALGTVAATTADASVEAAAVEEPVPAEETDEVEPAEVPYEAEPAFETPDEEPAPVEAPAEEPSSIGSETAAILAEALGDDEEAAPAQEPAEERQAQRSYAPAEPTVSAETAEMPASAASSIAAAAEKAPSEEELHLFGPFYRMKENRDQVTAALDRISLASYTGNIIITGNAVTARRVAQGLLELTREADSNFTGKIAKATGTALNKLSDEKFCGILNKIQNGALIIEHASTMEESAVQCLYNELEHRDRGVIVVMMDARKPLDEFLGRFSSLVGSFTARVDIRPLNDKALVDYGKDYANTRDYALDELAELALSSRISSMQSPNHRVTLKEVRDIVDEAISYASRKTPKVLVDMISHKRYDSEDRILLREKDFQHNK